MSVKLNFKLLSGELVEWLYDGYSDLIDNLEPEQDKPVFVYESFTKEDFELAQIEYHKYVKFKRALEDIENKCRFFTKDELRDMSKYNLNNCVLEWLKISEYWFNKEIKEILSLDSFTCENYIKKQIEILSLNSLTKGNYKEKTNIFEDSILIYYLIDETIFIKFYNACKLGHLEVARWLYSLEGFDIYDYDKDVVFICACYNGQLKVAKWLYSLGGINIHFENERAFKLTCISGYLEVVQWLHSLDVNIHIDNDFGFSVSCRHGHLDVAQWLYSLGGFNKSIITNPKPKIKKWLDTLP